jgi:hypothetical protein
VSDDGEQSVAQKYKKFRAEIEPEIESKRIHTRHYDDVEDTLEALANRRKMKRKEQDDR